MALAFTSPNHLLYPQATLPLPRAGTRPSSNQSKQTSSRRAPADGPQSGGCLATRCQEPRAPSLKECGGAWPYITLFSTFANLLWVSSSHSDQKQQGQCLVTPTGPAPLVWPWTRYTKQILGLNTQLRPSVSPCSGPACR